MDDIAAEIVRLHASGVRFRNEIVIGPGGQQVVLDDPAGSPIELFPAGGCSRYVAAPDAVTGQLER